MTVEAFVQLIIQGGALGVLAMVLWYGLRTALPRMVDSFTTSQAQTRQALDQQAKAFRAQQKMIARMAVLLIQHDATVRGQNPETLGTTEELLRRVMGE